MPRKSTRPESKSWVGLPKLSKPMPMPSNRKATKHEPPPPTSPVQRPRGKRGQ